MDFVRQFNEIGKGDAATTGGKGASLGEMTRAGIPVPPGFVILANAFEHFLEETDLNVEIDAILHSVDHREMHMVENASEKTQALILGAKMPEDIATEVKKFYKKLGAQYVAVRSSATAEDSASAAWAGQLDSFLNTTEEVLLTNVQKCWASLFTPRAIFYRFEKDLHKQKISVAVVIQKMVQSECSGIAFSVHPVTEDRNQLIIEAGFGLGDAIVSGSITPDSYVVEKEPRRIIDTNVNVQTRALYRAQSGEGNEWRDIPEPKASSQALTEKQILELSELVLRIENHYGFPCDIEWAFEKGKFYITQSRPITTLSRTEKTVFDKIYSQTFECIVRFPRISVLSAEAMNEGLVDNPLFHLADTSPRPSSVVFIDDSFEGWVSRSGRVFVSDAEAIRRIEQESLKCIPRNRSVFELILNAHAEELANPRKLTKLIEKANFASANTYKHFMFFTDESFKTSDHVLIEHLQKTRLELDTLVTTYLFPAFEKLIQALIQVHHFPRDIAERATTAEIIAALKEPTKLSEYSGLKSRPISFVLLDNRIEILFDKEAEEMQHWLAQQNPDKHIMEEVSLRKIIRGDVGNKGSIVRGKVRKLLARDFFDKRKLEDLSKDTGFVFVTSMTAPELVPYFKQALAFVTDEGGITCHAAIIARELGKPCIVRTKIATQVLKDGDFVEVDADNGIVKILEKNVDDFTTMVNMQSREHSLTYCYVWQIANQTQTRNLFESVKNILFINNGAHKKTRVWYDQKELENTFTDTGTRVKNEKNFFERVSKEFVLLTDELVPYCEGKKKIESLKEWERFYNKWIEWWAPMAIIFVLPESKTAPESIREKALALRAQTEKYSDSGDHLVMEYLHKQYPQYNELVEFMTPDEILHIEGLTDVQINEIRGRQNGYVFYNGTLYARNELDSIAAKYKLLLDEPHIQSSSEIRGSCASRGKVTGSVIVIYGKKDLARVTLNSVLVTEMTSPDYVPYLKKVAAIVTDEGGVNCHAAIVSREMNIPCIIGTKTATKILKDGDLVEVDADTGVVRIINPENP